MSKSWHDWQPKISAVRKEKKSITREKLKQDLKAFRKNGGRVKKLSSFPEEAVYTRLPYGWNGEP